MSDEAQRDTEDVDVETVDVETEEEGTVRDETPQDNAGSPETAGPPAAGSSGAADYESRVEELEARLEEAEDQLLRKQAELINYRKRVERERVELGARARAELLRELLPIFDDFERAVRVDADDVESYREGVELILRSFEALMSRLGVERISPQGDPFDPEFHEAMARLETDEVAEGHVLEVYQPGYVMGDRLLRPARVVVGVAPDKGEAGPEQREDEGSQGRADG